MLPLTGSCTVTTDGRGFELQGRSSVFASVCDFACLPRESEALISSVSTAPRNARSTCSPRCVPATPC